MSLTSKLSRTTFVNLILANQTKNNTSQIQNTYIYIYTYIKRIKKKEIGKINEENKIPRPFSTHPPFISNTIPPSSHLTHPFFQCLSRFTGIGFVRTKRHHFFRGFLTTFIQPQSTRGRGHLWGPGSQCLLVRQRPWLLFSHSQKHSFPLRQR